jgi:beta-lactam-binding protein with PASTA domain
MATVAPGVVNAKSAAQISEERSVSQRPGLPPITYRTPGGPTSGVPPRPRRRRRSLLPQIIEFAIIVGFLIGTYEGGIWLWNRTAPGEVSIPRVVGLPSEEALSVLKTAGLQAEVVSETPSEKVPEGVVMTVDPAANRLVKVGREVRLTVSAGSRWAVVPDVRQMAVERAKALLSKAKLSAGKQTVAFHAEVPIGYVINQNPQPGQRVARSSEVTLLISKGAQPPAGEEDQVLPSPSGIHTTEVDLTVPPGASLQEVRIVVHDKNGEQEVYRQSLQPGEVVHESVQGEGPGAIVETYLSGILMERRRF